MKKWRNSRENYDRVPEKAVEAPRAYIKDNLGEEEINEDDLRDVVRETDDVGLKYAYRKTEVGMGLTVV